LRWTVCGIIATSAHPYLPVQGFSQAQHRIAFLGAQSTFENVEIQAFSVESLYSAAAAAAVAAASAASVSAVMSLVIIPMAMV
jgi:hypothetical protein